MSCIKRIQLLVAFVILIVGWISPIYATKLWGQGLDAFLMESPLAAALLAQCSWVILLVPVRRAARRGEEAEVADLPSSGATLRAQLACAVPLSLLILCVHVAWYASFSLTNAATNTILWNTDTVTTPIVVWLLTGQRITWSMALGGVLGFVGTGFTLNGGTAGDTLPGCGLCLIASFNCVLHAVLAERSVHSKVISVTRLLGFEGVMAVLICLAIAPVAAVLSPVTLASQLSSLPSLWWLVFLGVASLLLNLGWLWCTEMTGAFWTAMVACLTMPLTMVLDMVFFDIVPGLPTVAGAALIVVGFAVASVPADDPSDAAVRCEARKGLFVDGGKGPSDAIELERGRSPQ